MFFSVQQLTIQSKHISTERFKQQWIKICVSALAIFKSAPQFHLISFQQLFSTHWLVVPLDSGIIYTLRLIPKVLCLLLSASPLPGLTKCPSVPSWPYIPVKAEPWQWASQMSEGPWASAALSGPARLREGEEPLLLCSPKCRGHWAGCKGPQYTGIIS